MPEPTVQILLSRSRPALGMPDGPRTPPEIATAFADTLVGGLLP